MGSDRTQITTFEKPERVDREKRTIYGFAAISCGEAAGHGLWIDETFCRQVAEAARAKPMKSRFGHPGLLRSGEGSLLGEAIEFRCDGGKTRADLKILKAADSGPKGTLGTHVMDLAEEAPHLLGASIVFARDRAAETAFERDHTDDAFRSPDPANTKNLRHARLAELHAVDVVDDPAANPDGMFSRPRQETIAMSKPTIETPAQKPAQADEPQAGHAPDQALGGRRVATLEELEAAFPDAPAFVIAQLKAGASLPEARLAFTALERDEANKRAAAAEARLAEIEQANKLAASEGVSGRAGCSAVEPGVGRFGAVEVGEARATIIALDNRYARHAFGEAEGAGKEDVDAAIREFMNAERRRKVFDRKFGEATSEQMDVAIRKAASDMLDNSGGARAWPDCAGLAQTSFAMGISGPDYAQITVKGIIGRFYKSITDEFAKSWAAELMWKNTESNQETETYRWLGQAPQLREWIGGRQLLPPGVNAFSITNKTWEATLPVDIEDWRFDKTGQLAVRFAELARTHVDHWESRLTTRITDDGVCYDGQNFFDTDHPAADYAESGGNNSSTYKNELTSGEITQLDASTPPTRDEIVDVMMQIVAYFRLYRDNFNRPYNDGIRSVRFMVPPALDAQFSAALRDRLRNSGSTNSLQAGSLRYNSALDIDLIPNSRLTGSTVVYAFRTDSPMRPFIGQEPVMPEFTFLGAGSDHAFKENQYLGGTKAVREVDYGQWAHAIKATLS